MTGFAILGPGSVANFHKIAIEANADRGAHLVAMGHYDPEKFNAIEGEYGVPCLLYNDLLNNPDVDVVSICTPSGQHAAQAIACAQAGKHVLVEKPMALSLDSADAMIEACEKAGVKMGVVFQRRAEPLFKRIHTAIQSGEIGTLTLGVVSMPYYRAQSYFDQACWRGTWALDGGGVLMNQGIHLVDLLLWYMGKPIQVFAQADTLHRNIEVEDTLVATLRFENGGLATITATTTAAPGFSHRLEVYGTQGGIQVEGEDLKQWMSVNGKEIKPDQISKSSTLKGSGGDPRAIPVSGHIGIFADFIDSIEIDKDPMINGIEGRRSLSVVLDIYRATEHG